MSLAPHRDPRKVRAWLDAEPSLEELQDAFPRDWEVVQRELSELVPRNDRAALTSYVAGLASAPAPGRAGTANVSQEVRRRMAVAAIKRLSIAAATGVTDGRVRFNLLNGWVAQKLLFADGGFTRKPVSRFWFRVVWPLLWQRRFLMPLVAKKGIYCFYSKPLIERLADLIGDRSCLEIAAGDGTLSRFLADAGVRITATDDHSWRDVDFPESVVREDAKDALKKRQPEVVVCSWPPANNRFERSVFNTRSVQLYIVIGSRHRFAAGSWATYEEQDKFDFAETPELSELVLPPELDAAVYIFQRAAA